MKTLKYRLTGKAPLLMHSDITANPIHPMTLGIKKVSSKRKKTEDDYKELAKLEFIASAYWTKDKGYYIPGKNIDATLLASAKMFKLGTMWKQGAGVYDDASFEFPDKKLTPETLFKTKEEYVDMQTVKVGQSKVVRCRPGFNEWSCDITVTIDEAKLEEDQIDTIVENAGNYVGLCDYRPRYGKFNAKKIK